MSWSSNAAESMGNNSMSGEGTAGGSLFNVDTREPDKIFGLNSLFKADPDPSKINLGIGVFRDSTGLKIPCLKTTAIAEQRVAATNPDPGYLDIMGDAKFREGVAKLVLENAGDVIARKRVLAAQTVGGTSGLRVGAEMLKICLSHKTKKLTLWQSDPTWENHRNIFSRAGFNIESYPYYNGQTGKLDFDGMLAAIGTKTSRDDVVLLHACCHNPSGIDIPPARWNELANKFLERGLVAFFDFAYQGFGRGLIEDRLGIEEFVKAGVPVVVAYSCSKNFSFYNERLGACIVIADSAEQVPALQSQMEPLIRGDFSNCPAHGARLFGAIMADPELRTSWEAELTGMRQRIVSMRTALIDGLTAKGLQWGYIKENCGMFSYIPLKPKSTELLRTKHHIYGLDSGGACRINVAALTNENLPRVIAAIVDVA